MRCNVCRSTWFVYDFAGDEPAPVGCVRCEWSKLVGGEDEHGLRQCIAPTTNHVYGTYHGRCGRWGVVNGMCWQHADKTQIWDRIYAWLRSGAHDATAELPEVYREVFSRALIDANLITQHERKTQRVTDLAERATKLREAKVEAETASVVYFMRREGLIKIGTTTKLSQRIKAISKGSCMPDGMSVGPVELLASTPGDRALERRLHRQFTDDRIDNTEWFRSSPRLLRLIARYQRRAQPTLVAA